MLFQSKENKRILDNFLAEAGNVEQEDISQKRFVALRNIVSFMSSNPQGWDDNCPFNSEHIGDSFLRSLVPPYSNERIDTAFVFSFRFLCEYDLRLTRDKELNFDLRLILNDEKLFVDLNADLSHQVHYARYQMPVNILKQYLGDERIKDLSEFSSNVQEAKALSLKIRNNIESDKKYLSTMKATLEEYNTAFNFVGLSQGFQKLLQDKNSEKKSLFWSLMSMGALILAPLLFQLHSISNAEIMDVKQLIPLAPILSIEVILIYFFRIILSNYKSVKTQIMQLELRQTLCQFIQSYADYSSEIKSKDESALEKFENLIFSGIMSDQDKLPTTFDGLDQVGNLVKSLRGS